MKVTKDFINKFSELFLILVGRKDTITTIDRKKERKKFYIKIHSNVQATIYFISYCLQ